MSLAPRSGNGRGNIARPERQLTLRARIVRGAVGAARTGWADTVRSGLRIANPHGEQAGLDEHLPTMHARVWVNRVCPQPGKSFHTNHRRPILQLVQDACGVHDLRTAPYDERPRYRLSGVQGEHASCTGTLRRVIALIPGSVRCIPRPVNLFMSVGAFPDGRVATSDNPSKPRDCVMFKAWIDSVVWYPTDLHVDIYEAT